MGVGIAIIVTEPFALSYCQQIVLTHDPKNRLVIDDKPGFPEQPYLDAAVSISPVRLFMAFRDQIRNYLVPVGLIFSFQPLVISAA